MRRTDAARFGPIPAAASTTSRNTALSPVSPTRTRCAAHPAGRKFFAAGSFNISLNMVAEPPAIADFNSPAYPETSGTPVVTKMHTAFASQCRANRY